MQGLDSVWASDLLDKGSSNQRRVSRNARSFFSEHQPWPCSSIRLRAPSSHPLHAHSTADSILRPYSASDQDQHRSGVCNQGYMRNSDSRRTYGNTWPPVLLAWLKMKSEDDDYLVRKRRVNWIAIGAEATSIVAGGRLERW